MKSTTHHVSWSPSEPAGPPSSPSEALSTVSHKAPRDDSSPDFPIVAMLRAPKLWLVPHSTLIPSVTPIPPSPASPLPSWGLEEEGGDITTARAVSLETLSQTTTAAPAEASHGSPAADSRETGEISSIQATKHPSSGPWVSLDSNNVTMSPAPSDAGILGTESGALDLPGSPISGGEATVDKVLATWLPLPSQGLVTGSQSTSLGSHEVTMSVEPTVALEGGTTEGPMKATMELVPNSADATWGSEPKSSISSTHVAVTIPGAQTTPTLISTSSQGHPEPEGQIVAQGSSGPLSGLPSHPWSSLASSMDDVTSVSSGEPTGLWEAPSTLISVSLGLDESDLNVVAGSPGLEAFWEEVASGQEGKFWVLCLS